MRVWSTVVPQENDFGARAAVQWPPGTAVVTGAGSGIGQACAQLLAGGGLIVAAGDLDTEALADLAPETGSVHPFSVETMAG